MKTLILTLTALLAQTSLAGTPDIWEGDGALFEVHGKPAVTYHLVVENTKTADITNTNVTVTLPDGTAIKQQCVMTERTPGKWSSECDHGKGGGSCFGEGLCISYEEDAMGRAFATTIVMDGPSDMRILRTELQNGQATRFFREKLHKR
ncbi:MAG: hypothetical protein K2X47_07925 [Bdellovibrionales bacterium]|nr:hypothetical protein [Bdellovibrionales bacterium]